MVKNFSKTKFISLVELQHNNTKHTKIAEQTFTANYQRKTD